MSEEWPGLSPIPECDEEKSTGASSSEDSATTLPELQIEIVPKRRNADESAVFYNHLRKRMRKYYRKLFNVRTDDSSSGTEFNVADYDEYTTVTNQDDLNVSYVIEQPDRESDWRDRITVYLGSLSSRKDSSEKERVSVSKSPGSKVAERESDKNDKSEGSAGIRREEDSHVEEKSADDEMETEEESDQLGENQDGERDSEKNDKSEDSSGQRREEDGHIEEKSADDKMETEEESDQLGENQEECGEEEESSKEGCERNDSKSDQMSKSQDIEEEESEQAEKDSDQSPEELEVMRSYNPAPSIDSLRHEPPSDTEEDISLNRFTHRYSLPQNEVESPDAAVPQTQARDEDEFDFLPRTSIPRKSKETGTKRPSDLVHEVEVTARKRYFRNIRLQTDETERQVSCTNVASQTDYIQVRHFGIQTEENLVANENVGTQTDLPSGDYRDIGIQVALQNEYTNVETQTGETEVEQSDAQSQADLQQETVRNVGVQTDERTEEEGRSFFERRGIFFFFF